MAQMPMQQDNSQYIYKPIARFTPSAQWQNIFSGNDVVLSPGTWILSFYLDGSGGSLVAQLYTETGGVASNSVVIRGHGSCGTIIANISASSQVILKYFIGSTVPSGAYLEGNLSAFKLA